MSRPCGLKCAYVNCGKSVRSELVLKLFRFPKYVNTSRQWISNSGKNIFTINNTKIAILSKDIFCFYHKS